MHHINHNTAIKLEELLGELYDCERGGVSGLVEAGYFEENPIEALNMVACYVCANEMCLENYGFDRDIYHYQQIFKYPESYDIVREEENYCQYIEELVKRYKKQ